MFRNSLWGESVLLYGSKFKDRFAVAYLVVSFVTLFGILYAWLRGRDGNHIGNDAPLRKAAFKFLGGSMILYLL